MVKVVFIEHDGNNHEVDAYVGENLMETAISNNVTGIDADCVGNFALGKFTSSLASKNSSGRDSII